jgi:hypothetical protein
MFCDCIYVYNTEFDKEKEQKRQLKKKTCAQKAPDNEVEILADIHEWLDVFRAEVEQKGQTERYEYKITKEKADREKYQS